MGQSIGTYRALSHVLTCEPLALGKCCSSFLKYFVAITIKYHVLPAISTSGCVISFLELSFLVFILWRWLSFCPLINLFLTLQGSSGFTSCAIQIKRAKTFGPVAREQQKVGNKIQGVATKYITFQNELPTSFFAKLCAGHKYENIRNL